MTFLPLRAVATEDMTADDMIYIIPPVEVPENSAIPVDVEVQLWRGEDNTHPSGIVLLSAKKGEVVLFTHGPFVIEVSPSDSPYYLKAGE